MIKNWAEDIKTKTKHMNRDAKAEYIMNYYWYHILLGVLTLGLLILGIYHVTWGKRKTEFSLVIVNQDINYQRDQTLQDGFAQYSHLPAEQIQADSDYMISYGDVQLKGINESSYEKFFFGWSAGAMDAVIMPKSFYDYCIEQNGRFLPLTELYEDNQTDVLPYREENQEEIYLQEDGVSIGVWLDQTDLSEYFMLNEQDPYVLVFPTTMKHHKAAGKFLNYALFGGQ